VYLAHLVVRQVDFSIRHHGPAAIQHWLDQVREMVVGLRVSFTG
jgi:hypothetical protein